VQRCSFLRVERLRAFYETQLELGTVGQIGWFVDDDSTVDHMCSQRVHAANLASSTGNRQCSHWQLPGRGRKHVVAECPRGGGLDALRPGLGGAQPGRAVLRGSGVSTPQRAAQACSTAPRATAPAPSTVSRNPSASDVGCRARAASNVPVARNGWQRRRGEQSAGLKWKRGRCSTSGAHQGSARRHLLGKKAFPRCGYRTGPSGLVQASSGEVSFVAVPMSGAASAVELEHQGVTVRFRSVGAEELARPRSSILIT
jgi:hypothetical protein